MSSPAALRASVSSSLVCSATLGVLIDLRRATSFVLLVLLAACTSPITTTTTGTPKPTATPDIQRASLDLVYTAFVSGDVHKVSSKVALEAALDGVRAEVKAVGGTATVETPAFQDTIDPQLADFRKFADAVEQLAAKTQALSPERIYRAAVTAMIRTSPDCHTFYFDRQSRIDSRIIRPTGQSRITPPTGTVLKSPPDEAGLEARMLEGGVAWIRWTSFRITGTYDIRAEVKKVLDAALAAGAKAWLFDLRGNTGGNGGDVMASWFLNGETVMKADERVGQPTLRSAIKDLRLPAQYQLPIAIVLNDAGGSDPEVFAIFLKEAKRATIVGQKTIGCVGAASPLNLANGDYFSVVVEEYSGAVSGTKYNNNGVPPDVEATDAQDIAVASKLLKDKIAGTQ